MSNGPQDISNGPQCPAPTVSSAHSIQRPNCRVQGNETTRSELANRYLENSVYDNHHGGRQFSQDSQSVTSKPTLL
ncbi:hypothetical protein PTT_08849 [Pyrenophora teres f. teres 0-1]|uniref:Uncharacterized protein n=1 Tax=Pyrenophora teres f. teres (strain 0-1) TaxID=861557 RepID=E3RKR2_PYRTT|nr:hypothetical protein PTT_08849 [Pyrenophora teres f. teres 0-1]